MTKRLHFLFQCCLHGLQLPKLLCLTMHFSKTLQGVQIHSFHDQRKVLLRFSSRTSCIFSNKMNAGMGCFLDYIEGIHFLVLKVVVSQWTGCQLCPSVCHFQRTRWWCVVGCSHVAFVYIQYIFIYVWRNTAMWTSPSQNLTGQTVSALFVETVQASTPSFKELQLWKIARKVNRTIRLWVRWHYQLETPGADLRPRGTRAASWTDMSVELMLSNGAAKKKCKADGQEGESNDSLTFLLSDWLIESIIHSIIISYYWWWWWGGDVGKNYPTTMRDEETWSPKGETTRKIRAET